MPLNRRRFALSLAGAALGTGTVGASPPAGSEGDAFFREAAPALLAPIRAAAQALGGPGLLKSYVTDGSEAFDRSHAEVAYTYDNAVAGLALLAAGETELASRLAEGLRLAQSQDRFWTDGRLRNAYAAGRQVPDAPASARPPGWWDAASSRWIEDGYAAGSASGPVAFAMLLWTAFPGSVAFRDAAERAAGWVERDCVAPQGFTGGTLGHEPQPDRQAWCSTEQNLDLAVAFARLDRRAAAAKAGGFVRSLWRPAEGRFAAGLTPQGVVNDDSAVDANLWPLLAFREAGFAPALDWVLTRHGLPAGAPVQELKGLDFNTDRDGIWLEGTAQAALLLRRQGRVALAERFLRTMLRERDAAGWVRASSIPWLTTGFYNGEIPFLYPRRGHLAANGWAVLAALDASPFDAPPA
ncbi:hypothetical protein MVG78_09100 [Roseomonas gilardii subsp. gilardii]|uniref:hypothetical protein n=1 Tax=Roseomonas gilardii TaxID=257708 RepID=UPI001FF8A839|nr:hypothetical protein [Roseomonas gilardii]UPG74256.1 hypothetical protein MVG78_09100 [Roseomonas gilardii subsp. gilardii]